MHRNNTKEKITLDNMKLLGDKYRLAFAICVCAMALCFCPFTVLYLLWLRLWLCRFCLQWVVMPTLLKMLAMLWLVPRRLAALWLVETRRPAVLLLVEQHHRLPLYYRRPLNQQRILICLTAAAWATWKLISLTSESRYTGLFLLLFSHTKWHKSLHPQATAYY